MTAREREVLEKLDGIERELRRIGFWDPALDTDTVRQNAASIVEQKGESPAIHMPFETWLQAVFIPSARRAAIQGNLPGSSQVGLMAMRAYDYHSSVPEATLLLRLLNEFDALVEERA